MDYPREGQNEVLSWVVSIFPRCFTVHSESAVVGGHTQDPEPVSLGFHKVTVSCTGRSTWTLKSGQTRPRREPPPPCHAVSRCLDESVPFCILLHETSAHDNDALQGLVSATERVFAAVVARAIRRRRVFLLPEIACLSKNQVSSQNQANRTL